MEAVTRTLRPLVEGQCIRCTHVFHPIATKPQTPSELVRKVHRHTIRTVKRKGKYLWLALDSGGLIVLHFKLDGQLIWFANGRELRKRANTGKAHGGAHVDVAFELDKGVLGFADQRHFGRVQYWQNEASCPGLAVLGVDALSKEFTASRLLELLWRSKRPLKEFLLEQARVAGIGNIYSCESLWLARLNPLRLANALSKDQARRLHKAIVSVLRRALECCLHPAPDFRDPEWWFQGLEKIVRVYDREGKPCRRCGAAVRRISQGGRSTYFCGRCQR